MNSRTSSPLARRSRHHFFRSSAEDQSWACGAGGRCGTCYQDRRVEKCLHLLSPELCWSRCARMSPSASAVSSEAMGLPVLNTQMPFFFCRGVELRRGAQRDLLALDRKIERVAWGEAQLVPENLGKDDAARSIEDDFAAHKPYYKKGAPIWGMVFRKKPNRFKVMPQRECYKGGSHTQNRRAAIRAPKKADRHPATVTGDYQGLNRFFRRLRLKKSPAPSTPSESSPKAPLPLPRLWFPPPPGGATTLTISIAVFEVPPLSLASKAKESAPEKPAAGA